MSTGPEVVVRAAGLGKRYRIGARPDRYGLLTERLAAAARAAWRGLGRGLGRNGAAGESPATHWALRDVSLEVPRGEVLGLIGPNGAGKTTLLKILSRITAPTTGRAEIRGRVGSLLEVGTGFHPELTGRENIYLNGAILGMKRAEIARQFDAIVAFAEIGRYLDTPVKRYSSGMFVRLAFAVAAHLNPEILLVDEVLAVGDYKFQRKCLGKMREVTGQGRTVLFVSHNMKAIGEICSRVLLLDQGRVRAAGAPAAVIRQYTQGGATGGAEARWPVDQAPGNETVRLLGVRICDEAGRVQSEFPYTEPITIQVTFQVRNPDAHLYLRVYLENEEGVLVLVTTAVERSRFPRGIHEARYTIPSHLLNEGGYVLQQVLFKEGAVTSPEDVARVDYRVRFRVDYTGKFSGGGMVRHAGVIRPRGDWTFTPREAAAHG